MALDMTVKKEKQAGNIRTSNVPVYPWVLVCLAVIMSGLKRSTRELLIEQGFLY